MIPNLPKESQGNLDNLHEKTLNELKDLLTRQEKLLSKQMFLRCLPDKGLKVKTFAESLEKLIYEKTVFEKNNKPSQSSSILINPNSTFSSLHERITDCDTPIEYEDTDSLQTNNQLKFLINPAAILGRDKKQLIDKRETTLVNEVDNENVTDDLSESLQKMHVSMKSEQSSTVFKQYINNYDRVMKRVEERRPKSSKESFKPHSSLMISNVEDLPDKYKYKSKKGRSYDKPINQQHIEESAACPPQYKYHKIQLVSDSETKELITKQEAKQEELKIQRAAMRLAEQLHIKMEPYNPETVDMAYRKMEFDSDDDDVKDDDVNDNDGISKSNDSNDDDDGESLGYPD